MPTEKLILVKVLGSQCGRIFMAGSDGNLYELEYKSTESPWGIFFDNSIQDQNGNQNQILNNHLHKCRKINHSKCGWKILNFFPPFLRNNNVQFVDPLIDLCIDNVRNVLYATSMNGLIDVFYLGNSAPSISTTTTTVSTAPIAVSVTRQYNVLQELTKYFIKHPNSINDPKGHLLKDPRGSSIIGLFPIPITVSRTVHAVLILGNGIRIYLTLLGYDKKPFSVSSFGSENVQTPIGLEITYVRYPPSVATIKYVLEENLYLFSFFFWLML